MRQKAKRMAKMTTKERTVTKNDNKDTSLHIRVNSSAKECWENAARLQGRKLSNWVEFTLNSILNKNIVNDISKNKNGSNDADLNIRVKSHDKMRWEDTARLKGCNLTNLVEFVLNTEAAKHI